MNKLNVKIAFFDIDGTLTNSNKEIDKSTINALNKARENDIKLVLCSGRSNEYLLTITSDKLAFLNNYTPITNEDVNMIRIKNIEDILDKNLYQFIIVDKNLEKLIKLENYLNNKNNIKLINYSLSYLKKEISNYYFFDVVNKDVNKEKNCSICFGDSVNDIDMFNASGIKVAMGNAIEELKNKGDYITDTNNNEGISKFFNENIL